MQASKHIEERILNNQGLIHHTIKKFGISPSSLEYDDYSSLGQIGLLKAASTFDESRKIRFASYAIKCIENEFLMYLRKEKKYRNNISLDTTICSDYDGNEQTLGETIFDISDNFEEKIIHTELFERVMNIILNVLTPRERIIMLCFLSNVKQCTIASLLNVSQCHISRLEKKILKKVQTYSIRPKHFKKDFSLSIVNNLYQIEFYTSNMKYSIFLQNSTSISSINNLNVINNNGRIIISLPAETESFFLLARIFLEIENVSLTF